MLFIFTFRKKHPRPVDLTQVIDFKSILESFNRSGEVPPGVTLVGREFDLPVLCLKKRPGMYNTSSLELVNIELLACIVSSLDLLV